jgi:hypothetical protein
MRSHTLLGATLALGACLGQAVPVLAQGTSVSDAECQSLRQKLGEHARLSEGVRRAIGAQAAAAPTAPAATAPPTSVSAPSTRAATIRARLEQIPKERQTLDDQRLAAVVRFELSRAAQIQGQITALDTEKATLERELATLPATPTPAPAPSAPSPVVGQPAGADPTMRIACKDTPAALESALKTRRRELGAREDQAGAVPLVGLKGQTPEQIGQELAGQLSAGAPGGAQVGLLDADGDGRLDGFADMPAPGVVRLVRQRTDGTLSVEAFPVSGSAAATGYGELTRRLDETIARQAGQPLADLLATRAAGPLRAMTQTADFPQAYAQFQAGNFADVARLGAPAARSAVFSNELVQRVRVVEIISALAGGASFRRTVVLTQPNDQESWEETTTIVRPVSYWRTDVEVARSRDTRTATGSVVGSPVVSPPSKFSLER